MKQCMDSENIHRRLKKIVGQVQAIDRMVMRIFRVRIFYLRSMRRSRLCIRLDRLCLRGISSIV